MRIAVIGANGRTGAAAVGLAAKRGHRVVAVSRSPQPPPTAARSGVESVCADVLDPTHLADALAGCDAVVSAVGVGSSRQPTSLYSAGTANLVATVRAVGVRRLAVVSAAPVGPRSDHPRFQRTIVLPLLERAFGATYIDMRRMEAQLVATSDLAWVALRPPRLVDQVATGSYRLAERPPPGGRRITIGDLAAGLLDVLDRPEIAGRVLYVAN